MSLLGISAPPVRALPAPSLHEGRIIDAPTSTAELVRVVIPSFGPQFWGPVGWPARVDAAGRAVLPIAGDSCIVAMDARRQVTGVVSWGDGQRDGQGASVADHAGLTTTAHGGIVAATDPRLSDQRFPVDASVTAAKMHPALRPSAGAGAEALRALGVTGSTAAAGNDARLSDRREPIDGSVSNAKVAVAAGIDEDKLALAVPTWGALPFASGWGDAGGAACSHARTRDGIVLVQGRAERSMGSSSQVIGTLPAGRRPTGEATFAVAVRDGAAGLGVGVITVGTSGAITVSVPYSYNSGSANYVSLDGLWFRGA